MKEELQKEVDNKEYSCLVRAVYGNFKISTLVRILIISSINSLA